MKKSFFSAVILAAMLLNNRPAMAQEWNFAVFGDTRSNSTLDSGVNEDVLSAIATDIANNRDVDFALVVGDLIYGAGNVNSIADQLGVFKSVMTSSGFEVGGTATIEIPYYPIRGNHEGTDVTAWTTAFSTLPQNGPTTNTSGGGNSEVGMTYSFTNENALILGLDEYANADTYPNQVNQVWVDSQLSGSTAEHVFAFGHEPAYQVSHADCLAAQAIVRDDFLTSLYEHNGQVYFAGHDHLSAITLANIGGDPSKEFYSIIDGSGGAPGHAFNGIYPNTYGDQSDLTGLYYNSTSSPDFYYTYSLVTVDANLLWVRLYGTKNALAPDWLNLYSAVISGTLRTDTNTLTSGVDNRSMIEFNQSFDGTYAYVMSGTGELVKSGIGNLTLTGLNTYIGLTSVTGGTLSIANVAAGAAAQALGENSGLNISGGGTLRYTGAAGILDKNVNIGGGNGTISNAGTGLLTLAGGLNNNGTTLTLKGGANGIRVSGQIGGAAADSDLVINGGIVTLAAANNYNGSTNVYGGGTLVNGILHALPSNTVLTLGEAVGNSGGTYDLAGFSQTVAGLSSAGTGALVVTNSGTLSVTHTLTVNNDAATSNSDYVFGGVIKDGATAKTALTKTGNKKLTLSGTNTYSGPTTVHGGGTLQNGITNALPTGTVLTLGEAVSNSVGIYDLGGFNQTIAGLTTAGTGAQLITNSAAGVGMNTLTVNNDTATSNSDYVFGGVIEDGATAMTALTKTGNKRLTLSGTNTYSGPTTVHGGGTLQNGVTNALPTGTVLTLGEGVGNTAGTYDLAGFDQTVAGLTTSGTGTRLITNSGGGTSTLTVNNDSATSNSDYIFGGVIEDGAMAQTSLTKTGDRRLILTGLNTYSGLTSIEGGTLSILFIAAGATAQALGENLAVNIGGGGTLEYLGAGATLDKDVTIGDGNGTISNAGTGLLTLSGELSKNGTTLTLNGGANGILVTGVVSGASSYSDLVINGGAVTLANANTYNGPTYVYGGGTLVNGVLHALPSDTVLTLGEAAGNTDGTYDVGGFDQTVAGLATAGTGTQVITNSGAGGTNILTVNNDTTTSNSDYDFGGVIEDGATAKLALTKTGDKKLTLSGTNTYSGPTTVQGGGTLQNGITNALPTGTVLTLGEAVSNSVGIYDLGGFNQTIAGLTTAGTGAQLITNSAAGAGTNTLTINNDTLTSNSDYVFGGVIEDGATAKTALTKTGDGMLTLAGTNTYTGRTTISGGTMRVTNARAFGMGPVTNNAVLDVGTVDLLIGGTYDQVGSTLKLTVNSDSDFGRITALGAATVTGGVIDVTVNGFIANNATLAIISSVGGLTYDATAVNVLGDTRCSFAVAQSGDSLILTASRAAGGFASDATPGDTNARNVGTALDSVTFPSSDMEDILNKLSSLGSAKVAAALDVMGPDVSAGVVDASTSLFRTFLNDALNRVDVVRVMSRDDAIEQALNSAEVLGMGAKSGKTATKGLTAVEPGKLKHMWAKEYGSYLKQNSLGGMAGYHAQSAGTALGVDYRYKENMIVGVAGGYANGNVDSDANSASTEITSAQAVVYGGYLDPDNPLFIDAAGSVAFNRYEGQRGINIENVLSRTAHAIYNGQQYGVSLASGYKFAAAKGVEFIPLFSLEWSRLHLERYSENGAEALNLKVSNQDYNQFQSGLGARLAASSTYRWGTLTSQVHGKWMYDFIGDPVSITASFIEDGAAFVSKGNSPARSGFNIGSQLLFDFKNDVSIIGSCDADIKDQYLGIQGWLKLRQDF